ncbi:hypothetical protein QA635_07880 [Bradyrhizobium brasilense]|uniref:hypothetical protein n=1 Tax=Bradyrhizobium brasilense TaxID=1419277 RepID=UPI0024B04FAC|nr:hypothetical protein [Bradyrhizobium australafricanum]WFU34337.1 hypothetical protein QA635_07880 [Bradyrhizobium australafricanum]
MINDIFVRLDGTAGDFARLAAVSRIAATFESHIARLLFNVFPAAISDVVRMQGPAGRQNCRTIQGRPATPSKPTVLQRLERLQQLTFFRRFDVEDERDVADTSVAPRLNGQPNKPRVLIEELLHGAGRHLFLVPEDKRTMAPSITSWLAGTEAGNLRALCPNPSPICSERGKFGFSWWSTNVRPRPMR